MFYRLRKRLNSVRFWLAARGIYRTPPTPCDPRAECTIHTMLGRSDLLMYLVAIKSLLRFRPASRVAAHSDGSLAPSDETLLRKHIPGVQIIRAGDADERVKKLLNPFLMEWRAHDPCWRRLIDTEVWRQTPRRVIIDSDLLTLRRPDALLEWIADSGNTRPLMFGAVDTEPAGPVVAGSGNGSMQNSYRERLAKIGAAVGMPATFFQGGTAGCYGCTRELSLAEIERQLKAALAAGVPMGEWGGDQCLVIYVLSHSNPIHLSIQRYLNYSPEAIDRLDEAAIIHFYGTHRYHAGTYLRLTRQVVRELKHPEQQFAARA